MSQSKYKHRHEHGRDEEAYDHVEKQAMGSDHHGGIEIDMKAFMTRQAIYGNYAGYYGCRVGYQMNDARLVLLQSQFADLFKGKRVLDIGCNTGVVSMFIARNLDPQYVLGIDIDPVLIKKARHQLQFQYSLQCPHANSSKQEKQETSFGTGNQAYFPISMPIVFGCIPMVASPSTDSFPMNINFKCKNWIEIGSAIRGQLDTVSEFPGSADIILCLSITKWIQLNWGDHGIMTLFKKAYQELKPGGILILEPQSLSSYAKKKHLITETHKRHMKEMRITPDSFVHVLLQIGFIACIRVVPATGSSLATGFDQRPIYLLKKSPIVCCHPV